MGPCAVSRIDAARWLLYTYTCAYTRVIRDRRYIYIYVYYTRVCAVHGGRIRNEIRVINIKFPRQPAVRENYSARRTLTMTEAVCAVFVRRNGIFRYSFWINFTRCSSRPFVVRIRAHTYLYAERTPSIRSPARVTRRRRNKTTRRTRTRAWRLKLLYHIPAAVETTNKCILK